MIVSLHHEKKNPLDAKDILVLGEITSTNHREDRTTKYSLYAKLGIPVYVIADRRLNVVTVYSLEKSSHDLGGRTLRRNPERAASRRSVVYKAGNVFSSSDIICYRFFREANITAANLLCGDGHAERVVQVCSRKERERREEAEHRTEEERKRRKEAERKHKEKQKERRRKRAQRNEKPSEHYTNKGLSVSVELLDYDNSGSSSQ